MSVSFSPEVYGWIAHGLEIVIGNLTESIHQAELNGLDLNALYDHNRRIGWVLDHAQTSAQRSFGTSMDNSPDALTVVAAALTISARADEVRALDLEEKPTPPEIVTAYRERAKRKLDEANSFASLEPERLIARWGFSEHRLRLHLLPPTT